MKVRRLRSFLVTLALGVAALPAAAQDDPDEALAPELLSAQKIFVKQTLIDPKLVSRLRSELGKLERFEIVKSEEEADIIASLSATAEYTQTASESQGAEADVPMDDGSRVSSTGIRPMGTVRVLQDLYLQIVLPDGTQVWNDSVPLGSLTGNASKKLAKRLGERLDAEN
jgi:hypothetical protein